MELMEGKNSLGSHTLMETGMSWAGFPSAPRLCSPEHGGCLCVSVPLHTWGAALPLINKTVSSEEGAAGMFIPMFRSSGEGSASSAFVKIDTAMKILPLI